MISKSDKILIKICLSILVAFAFSICMRIVTRQILTRFLGMDHPFVKLVWFDNTFGVTDQDQAGLGIDWQERYPFVDETEFVETGEMKLDDVQDVGLLDKYNQKVISLENKIDNYASNLVMGYYTMVKFAKKYDDVIGWNFASFGEYNGVIELDDGYLSSYVESRDCTEQAKSLSELDRYCKDNNINFLYVQAPYKISEYQDRNISGKTDFSNQNANNLLHFLEVEDVDYYDIRKSIYEQNLDNHELFYRTDHHWTTFTGVWAAQQVLEYCNETYGWNTPVENLDINKFNVVTYPELFLGSQGKKVTLSRTGLDDFSLLYPQYETFFHYRIENRGIDKYGDYSICYDMNKIDEKGYYCESCYHACNYGDQDLVSFENLKCDNDKKILIVHDSFGDCMVSGLALGVKQLDSIDLRSFDGSLKSYISSTKPDLVIVMYNAGNVGGEINYSSHQDMFDFR